MIGFEEGLIRLEPNSKEFLDQEFYNLGKGVFLYKGTTKVLFENAIRLTDRYDWTNGSIWLLGSDALGPFLQRKIDDGE